MTDLGVKWLAEISEVPMSNLTQQMQASDLKDYIAFSSIHRQYCQTWQNP
jgi:hypothetical protein